MGVGTNCVMAVSGSTKPAMFSQSTNSAFKCGQRRKQRTVLGPGSREVVSGYGGEGSGVGNRSAHG